jgi:multicomponent Na+:H+ antiporter subunit E
MNRFAPLLLSTAFRLLLWGLLTADPSPTNLLIGVVVALLIPRARSRPIPAAALLAAVGRSLLAIPLAYAEALALITARSVEESEITQPATAPTIPLLIFLDVFRITLTPFTIALGLIPDPAGDRYRIHQLRPRRPARPESSSAGSER